MRDAVAEHAELQFGRRWPQVVPREICGTVADNLMLTDTDTANATAPFGADTRPQHCRLRAFDGGGAANNCFALFGQVFVQVGTHNVVSLSTCGAHGSTRPWRGQQMPGWRTALLRR